MNPCGGLSPCGLGPLLFEFTPNYGVNNSFTPTQGVKITPPPPPSTPTLTVMCVPPSLWSAPARAIAPLHTRRVLPNVLPTYYQRITNVLPKTQSSQQTRCENTSPTLPLNTPSPHCTPTRTVMCVRVVVYMQGPDPNSVCKWY
jgi:hypothetical protein